MSSFLQQHLAKRKSGVTSGIYSVCSAHPWVIQASVEQALEDRSLLLVEATSNQVNQFGGYTGMRPANFREFVLEHVRKAGLPEGSLILGGDHLGPNPWRSQPAAMAMANAEAMVAEYVQAGFTKIHLDASMACGGDPTHLKDEAVAERAARLCLAAERACKGDAAPVYVIGTEVPTPGGATHALDGLQVTSTAAAEQTLEVHRRVFHDHGLADAWRRTIALVVQPGVEFGHDSVVSYDRKKAQPLVEWLRAQPENIVFEAHSTDYQIPDQYIELVQDGFAILKVGPALTFAMREALYMLEAMESQLVPPAQRSHLSEVVEKTMLREPANWQMYYEGTPEQQRIWRTYSYSDRIRYYWSNPRITQAVNWLIANLSAVEIPESMVSQYLPTQYDRLRRGKLTHGPVSLIVDRTRDVLRLYAAACPRV